MESELAYAKDVVEESMSWGTMNYFTSLNLWLIPPIDFVFIEESNIEVLSYSVVHEYRENDMPLSGHYPILVDFKRN